MAENQEKAIENKSTDLAPMEAVLKKAIERINSGQLDNEAQVKQSVIVPILRGLDWDDANPDELVPEYAIPHSVSGRADYALCRSRGMPLVFIEAKKLGHADESGEEQLFKYAFGQGVPLLILTDGNVWNFYLAMAEGIPADRRFYRAVLTTEEKTAEYARSFNCYLNKARVLSGKARQTAEEQHTSNRVKEKANSKIPKVWRTLLDTPDPDLRRILAVAVENECGTRPELDDLDVFLERQSRLSPQYTPPAHRPAKPSGLGNASASPSSSGRIVGYIFNGKQNQIGAGNRTLGEILKEFDRLNSTFMPRFAAATAGRTRRLVALKREDLYDQKDLIDYSFDLENGWWLGTNISARDVRKNVNIACGIADVDFGSQLTLIER